MQRFNFNRFSNGLGGYKKTHDVNHKGISNVISTVWNRENTRNVDFNSFSKEDIEVANDHLSGVLLSDVDDIEPEDIKHSYNNYWSVFYYLEYGIYHLCKTEKRKYLNDDDFI